MNNKKSMTRLVAMTVIIALGAFPSFADEGGKHKSESNQGHGDHVKEAGPNGGRIVEGDGFKLEFFVTENRRIQISFLNEQDEVRAPKDETVALIGGDRSNPTRLEFETKGNVLISKSALPDISNMPAILQIKPTKDAQWIRERFNINMSTCPECSLHEYACICDH